MKKKLLLVCTTVAFGILTVAGISQQNVPQLSDVALANIEALSSGECAEGCDNTTTGPCWQEQQIVFPPYGLTGNACIFTNNTDDYCTGKYIDPNTGQLN